MRHSIFKYFSVWLILLGCSTAYCQIYLLESPRFAESGQAIEIRAFADNSPAQVQLNWASDTQSGSVDMTQNADSGYWTAAIPAQAVQGTELSYTVNTNNDQSPDCTLCICTEYTPLKPQAMTLKQTVLTRKRWNSNDNAFGLLKPEKGPAIGPASIAYHKGTIYLLDSVKKRVLRFNKTGKPHTAISVPTSIASDLVIDPTDDSLLVVSQLEDKVFRFQKGKLRKTQSVPLKKSLGYPTKFSYDRHSRTLFARKQNQRENLVAVVNQKNSLQTNKQPMEKNPQVLTEIQGSHLILKIDSNPQVFAVSFDRPVGCIDEAAVDDNGVAWILYTLRGDYRIRRVARIDTANAHAETAQLDIWFSFDATRRMTLTDNGVALMAGNETQGRIVAFDYMGGF